MKTLEQLLIACRDNPSDEFLREVCRDAMEETHGHRMIEPFIPARLAITGPPTLFGFPIVFTDRIQARRWRTQGNSNFHPFQLNGLSFLLDGNDYGPPSAVFDRELTPEETREMDNYIAYRFGVTLPLKP